MICTHRDGYMRSLTMEKLMISWIVTLSDDTRVYGDYERPEMENQYLKDIPYYNCRNILKPGISGWAQVNYPYGASISDSSKKLSYDIYYICHFSILLDLLILFKTIKLVLIASGSKPKEIKNNNPKTS